MARVTGIGGIFFRAEDPEALQAWYREHLGMEPDHQGYTIFWWRRREADLPGSTVWAPFPADTTYFDPTKSGQFMINYRVDDLDGVLKQLRAAGVEVDERIEEHPFGRFAWARDAEGNRFELWQPDDAN